jgi:DNA-binding transcriptional LysR family regulator
MLDVRRMQVLRAVVSSGSVTAAAAHLGYTPSAISQQVAALEREAGIALLERAGRGVQPTAAGRLLTEHAAVIGHHLAETESALGDLREGRTGRLAIRYFSSVGPTLLAPALAKVRREHAALTVDLTLIDYDEPFRDARRDGTDITLMIGPGADRRPGVSMVRLLDDAYYAVLPADHPLGAKRVLDLADLVDQPWVGSEPPGPCLDTVVDACAAAGFTPHVVARSEDYTTAQHFVAAGLGVSLIPRLGLSTHLPGLAIRKVRNPEPVRTVFAAVRESSLGQPAVRTLLDALTRTKLPRVPRAT